MKQIAEEILGDQLKMGCIHKNNVIFQKIG